MDFFLGVQFHFTIGHLNSYGNYYKEVKPELGRAYAIRIFKVFIDPILSTLGFL